MTAIGSPADFICRQSRGALSGSAFVVQDDHMRVVVIRHHEVDEAGFIGAAFAARGAEIVVHQVPDDGPLPGLDGVDHIIVLGSVLSVYDQANVGEWIGAELAWLRQADQARVPVLG
ncbi:MAG: hypothetical protein ACRDNZ_17220, partial [Streptosporangiaceae bacterium]